MYKFRHNLQIGFHGCDESVRDILISLPNQVIKSQKPYDWLGHGFYIWENNLVRAQRWAVDKYNRNEIKKPSVVGVLYTLSHCLDFTDSEFIDSIAQYYFQMRRDFIDMKIELPVNDQVECDLHQDKLIRKLDCSVIEYCHYKIAAVVHFQRISNGSSHINPFDSVRGIFTEGGPAFPGAGIQKKNHIQICIRNLDMIKGFFIPKV